MPPLLAAAVRRLVGGLLWLTAVGAAADLARAQSVAPAPRPDAQFDFMNLLADHGLHNLADERWNAYGQLTLISSWQPPFAASYTNLHGSNNSLINGTAWSFTGTATLFLGLKLWPGGEAYLVPELISERPLSGLRGLGGAIQNFELQKNGSETPVLYRARAYLRQTVGLGNAEQRQESDPLQLATVSKRRRLVFVAGSFSLLDFFDKNSVVGDLRQTFFSLGFLTYSAWDFNSDARGYSYGGVFELYWDDWSLRFARVTPPPRPNQSAVTFQLDRFYGDQLELEHDHLLFGRAGAVRLLAFRNRDFMGRFADALAAYRANPSLNAAACGALSDYGSTNSAAPDLCFVRGPQVKIGLGLSLEQHLSPDWGVFVRGMIADGQSEVDAYTSADRSLSLGAVAKGGFWGRAADLAGLGVDVGWVSAVHAAYLAAGGVDGFVGDGRLRAAPEVGGDAFYSVQLWSSLWLAGDYQLIASPGFNADRGPVQVLSARLHAEF